MASTTAVLRRMLPAAAQLRPVFAFTIDVILVPLKTAPFPSAAMTASCRHRRSGSVFSRSWMMASDDDPCLSRSRILGPRRGSVRCCVRTAPTFASAHAQRLPTAIDDVVTTAPSIPVLGHRPAIENVMCPPTQRTAGLLRSGGYPDRACLFPLDTMI